VIEGKEDRDRHGMRLPFVEISLDHLDSGALAIDEHAPNLKDRERPTAPRSRRST
jgi:hypothetical protein